jgi:hypothetical protein
MKIVVGYLLFDAASVEPQPLEEMSRIESQNQVYSGWLGSFLTFYGVVAGSK